MGMYDYLGGYQIKLFYIPLFYKPFSDYDGCSLSHSGGSLLGFGEGDELPLKTLYYKYPNNFCIFDDNCVCEEDGISRDLVHVIKDGKYLKTIELENLETEFIGECVYSYYGYMLNIETKEDFYTHLKLRKELYDKRDEVENKYYPEGVFNVIKNNMSHYLQYKKDYQEELENLKKIYKPQLYKRDNYYLEKRYGEYIDVLVPAYLEKYKPTDLRNYKEYYEEILKEFIEFTSKNEDISDKYFEYFKDVLSEEHKNILRDLLIEICN